VVESPGGNGGGKKKKKDHNSRTGRDETKVKAQKRMERSRKRSSSAGSEKMERVNDK
jgi:hypothetical protein